MDTSWFWSTPDESPLKAVLDQWQPQSPGGLVLALTAETDTSRVPVLQRLCRERGLGLAGGVFPALHRDAAFVAQGAWLFLLPPGSRRALVPVGGLNPADAAAAVDRACAPGSGDRPPTRLFLFDALLPSIASMTDEMVLRWADSVRYLGVCAGSETFRPLPCLFDETQLIDQAVLAIDLPPGLSWSLSHGYQAPAESLTATATRGNRIRTLNWQPAFPVYQDFIHRTYGQDLNRENFYGLAVHFPLGIRLANGQTLVRIPVGFDEDGSLFCVGEVPENSLLTLLQAPDAADPHTVEALSPAIAGSPQEALVFYCAGRRMHCGAEAAQRELGRLSALARTPLAGALSLGEVGGAEGATYPGFHNGALVAARWARP